MTASHTKMSRTRRAAFLAVLAMGTVLSHTTTTQAAPRELAPVAFKSERASDVLGEKEDDGERQEEYARTAKALELGTRRMASHLLTRTPEKELREAAGARNGEDLAYPIQHGHFVRGFGFVRKHKKHLPHLGVDIAAKPGTPIHVAQDGIVGYADDGVKGYGNLAIVIHPDGSVTSYAHCSKLLVVPGQQVKRGEVIAQVGSTGISKGPHLHFEYRKHGRPTNPMARFDRDWFEAETGNEPALASLDR